jgi:hypothetical protein
MRAVSVPPSTPSGYAEQILAEVGAGTRPVASEGPVQPAAQWAESGAMGLTGWPDAPPQLAPAGVTTAARGAALALQSLGGGARAIASLDGPGLLGERAAHFGWTRRGGVSPGGSCRLLRCADGWIAVNLARPDDFELLPAWIGISAKPGAWESIASALAPRGAAGVVERARLLGLPVAPVQRGAQASPGWLRVDRIGRPREGGERGPARVVDLSSLWAGPLCAELLQAAGADVTKVESSDRPDGARRGEPGFFDLLNAGKRSVALDFATGEGRAALDRLIRCADIVIESSRPRALRQLGIEARRTLREVPGLTWVSITGYGRGMPEESWVAFGDDATAAAGLVDAIAADPPIFCGDALADPLTGLHAAVAALACHAAGGGALLDLSLVGVARHALSSGREIPQARVIAEASRGAWSVEIGDRRHPVRAPRSRPVTGKARPLGADTAATLSALGRC